jgi:hypothetical protein
MLMQMQSVLNSIVLRGLSAMSHMFPGLLSTSYAWTMMSEKGSRNRSLAPHPIGCKQDNAITHRQNPRCLTP